MAEFSVLNYALPTALLTVVALILARRQPAMNAPALVLLCLWIGLFVAHGIVAGIGFVPLYPSAITANILAAIAVSSLAISFSFWRRLFAASSHIPRDSTDRSPRFHVSATLPGWALILMAVYALAAFFLTYRAAMQMVGSLNVIGSMQLLRFHLNYGGGSWGWLEYAGLAALVFSVYSLAVTRGRGKGYYILPFIIVTCALGISVISTQRTSILMLLVVMFFSQSRRALPGVKAIFALFVAFATAFLAVGILVGKIGGEDGNWDDAMYDGFGALSHYLLSPLSAFDVSKIWTYSPADLGYTLRFFVALFNAIGLGGGEIKDLVMSFAYVPGPTNVYTFAYAAISDYGMAFPVYLFVVGGILAFVFSLPRRFPVVRVMQGFAYYPLFMTVFQDQFVTIMSSWLQVALLLYFCHLFTIYRRVPVGHGA